VGAIVGAYGISKLNQSMRTLASLPTPSLRDASDANQPTQPQPVSDVGSGESDDQPTTLDVEDRPAALDVEDRDAAVADVKVASDELTEL